MAPELAGFLSGMIAMGFLVVAAFFLRFWRQTRDFLFLAFAFAFLLLACGQALISMFGLPLEERSWVFLLRLAAFSVLIAAIVRKNLAR